MFSFISRLIELLIVIWAIRRVIGALSFVQRFWQGGASRPVFRAQQPRQPVSTLLQQDPVCGTYVSADASLKKLVHGHVIHFCSPECRDRYNASDNA